MNESNIPGVDSAIPSQNAVSVYSQDAMDDFPVLKAFQQYIDAEQAKARKRILSLGIFFGVLTGAIIAVFVILLMNMTIRNQQLNDRLLEFAMKERDRGPVVVQPAPQAESSAFMASLAAKLEALQNKISEGMPKKAEAPAEPAASKAPPAAQGGEAKPSAEALEIERLRAQLAVEREKAAVEKERRRQAELEEYRRKHYPELYRAPVQAGKAAPRRGRASAGDEIDEILEEVDDAINYFDDEENESRQRRPVRKARRPARNDAGRAQEGKGLAKPPEPEAPEPAEPQQKKADSAPVQEAREPAYSIPVEVKRPKRMWSIPAE